MPRIDWIITELNIHGGAENFIRLCAPRVKNSGVNLRVITLENGGEWIEELRSLGLQVIELGFSRKNFILPIIRLMRLWYKEKPVLVHTHLYHAGLVGRWIAYILKIPIIVVHQHGYESSRSLLRSYLDRFSSKLVNKYIASCEAVSQILRVRERIPSENILVIFNGVSTEEITNPIHKISLINDLVKQNTHLISTVGRLSPEKGQIFLIQAMKSLLLEKINVNLIIIGTGPEKNRLVSEVRNQGLIGKVHFMGDQRNVTEWLSASQIFVLPSLWEGISLALLEAMWSGLPVIATNVGGTPEIISHQENGLLIPLKDPEAITRAILQIINEPDLKRKISNEAKKTILNKFNIDRTTQELCKLYADLLQTRNINW